MAEKYRIHVTGTQFGGGTRDAQSFDAPCDYRVQNGVHYLTYTEPAQVRVTLKLGPDRAVMLRSGGTRMVFDPARATACDYVTAAGAIPFEIRAHEVTVCLTDAGGAAHLRYALHHGGALLSENEIAVRLSLAGQ